MEFWLTMDVAKRLGKSPETVRWYAKRGALPSICTPGGVRLFQVADVEEFARKIADAGDDHAA